MGLFKTEPEGLEGINAAFEKDIAPHLAALEDRRKKAERRGYILLPLLAIGVLLIAAGLHFTVFENDPDGPMGAVTVIVFGFWGAYHLAFWGRSKVKGEHKRLVVQTCADFMKLHYLPEGKQAMIDAYQGLAMLPAFDRRKTEDGIDGDLDGVAFELTEIKLEKKHGSGKNTRYVVVFQGFLLSMDFPKVIKGVTTVRRKSGLLGNLLGNIVNSEERVKLEDPHFEDHFDVYATDQVEARYLLTPGMMERLLKVAARYDDASFSFDGGRIHIACKHHDMMEAGSDSSDLNDLDLVRRTLTELATAKQFSNMLALETKTRV